MNFRIVYLENEIIIDENVISTILIENKKLFRKIVDCFFHAVSVRTAEEVQDIILSDQNRIVSIHKELLLITDIYSFDFQHKKIQEGLYKYLEKQYMMDYEMLFRYQKNIEQLQVDLYDLIEELPFTLTKKESVGIIELLKVLSIKIDEIEYRSALDRVYLLLDLIECLHITDIVVFVNLNRYLDIVELGEVYKYIMYKKIKVLFLEQGEEREPLVNEKIVFIDSDYDEFILYN